MDVNFITEFTLFMQYARDNGLTCRERMLWVALFYCANDRARYNGTTQTYDWPEGFIPVSNGELQIYGGLDKRSVETLRNSLKQRGLIDFAPGQRNKRPPSYRINYLSASVGYKTVPNYDPNNVPKSVPNAAPKTVPNAVPNPLANKININKDRGRAGKDASDDDSCQNEERGARAELKAAASRGIRQHFGRPAAEEEAKRLARMAEAYGQSPEMLQLALQVAAANGARDPLAYCGTIFAEWDAEQVRSEADYDEYQLSRDGGGWGMASVLQSMAKKRGESA